jgi:hypothetical protein
LIQQTTFVRDVNIVRGILVYVLPTYVVGPFVDINIDFFPWPSWFFGQVLIDWNWVWNNVNIVINVNNVNCPPEDLKKLIKPISNPTPPPGGGAGGGGGGGLPPRCADGSFPNAYGACKTPITSTCGPNMTAYGNFCLPISVPTCARGTAPTKIAGGGFQCLPVGVVTCLNGHLEDGKCKQDPPPCTGDGCGPVVVTQPNCGLFGTNFGRRCTPNQTGGEGHGPVGVVVGTTGGSSNPPTTTTGEPPPRGGGTTGTVGTTGSGGTTGTGGITVGGNNPPSGPDNNLCLKCGDCCVLRHPPTHTGGVTSSGPVGIVNTGTTSSGGSTPIRHLPTGVFTAGQPPSSNKPSYVMGRGGGGLNLFNAGASSATKTASVGNIASLRSSPAPIFHAMPSLGGFGGGGGKIK